MLLTKFQNSIKPKWHKYKQIENMNDHGKCLMIYYECRRSCSANVTAVASKRSYSVYMMLGSMSYIKYQADVNETDNIRIRTNKSKTHSNEIYKKILLK